MEQYLSHHGILGQKWGKRNGPPYPLDYNDHSMSEKKNLEIYSFQKLHHDKLINQYKNSNEKLSNSEIEKILQRNFKLAKSFLIAGGVLALGSGAYYACINSNNADLNNDYILKAGSKIFRVSESDSNILHDNFYATFNKKDANYYAGLANNGTFGENKNLKTYVNKKNIKIAGIETLEKYYDRFTNELDSEDKQFLNRYGLLKTGMKVNGHSSGFMEFFKLAPMADANVEYFKNKSDNESVRVHEHLSRIFEKFKNELKDNGYEGIVDTNDFVGSFSSLTKTPVIYFDSNNFSFKSLKPINQKVSVIKYYASEEPIQKIVAEMGITSLGLLVVGTGFSAIGSDYVNKGKILNDEDKRKNE